jgi:hypothetical protein
LVVVSDTGVSIGGTRGRELASAAVLFREAVVARDERRLMKQDIR